MPPVLGATDDYLFVEGTHRQLYDREQPGVSQDQFTATSLPR